MSTKERIIERFGKNKPASVEEFIDVNRRIYNSLCRSCQVRTVKLLQKGGANSYELLCDKCKIKTKSYEQELNDAI